MLKDIIAVSGQRGLFRIISQIKNGVIVESLEDKKRSPVYASSKISALKDISIYTDEGEIPLSDVFKKISDKENGGKAISETSEKETLTKYFEEVLPEYDRERVYTSDIKKSITWYNILHKTDMLKFEEEKEEEEGDKTGDEKEDKNEEIKMED